MEEETSVQVTYGRALRARTLNRPVRPLILSDTENRLAKQVGWEYRRLTKDVSSWICVPLMVEDQILGDITIDSFEKRKYHILDMEIRNILTLFAIQAALAIRNRRLLFELETKVSQLSATKDLLENYKRTHENSKHLLKIGLLLGEDYHNWRAQIGTARLAAQKIQLDVEDLKKPTLLQENRDFYLDHISQKAVEIATKIDMYLKTLAKSRGEIRFPEPVLVDIVEVVHEVLEKKRISSHIKRPPQYPISIHSKDVKISGPKSLIEDVFHVVIENSLDAMETGEGQLFFVIEDTKHKGVPCLQVDVTDTGRGVDRRKTPFLFAFERPFVSKKGSGLGLVWVRGFLNTFGGEINLLDTSEKGTTFRICLPKLFEPLE
jgi:signal transduction histidine kinase